MESVLTSYSAANLAVQIFIITGFFPAQFDTFFQLDIKQMTSGIRVAKFVFLFLMRFATVPEKHLGEVWVRLSKSPLKSFFSLASLALFSLGLAC